MHQHTLVSLGYAAECRACVDEYMREPSPPHVAEVDEGVQTHAVVEEESQKVLATPSMNARTHSRPAPKARSKNLMADKSSFQALEGDTHVHQLDRDDRAEVVHGAASSSCPAPPPSLPSQGDRPRRPAPEARQRNVIRDDCDGSVPPSERALDLIPSCAPDVQRDDLEDRSRGANPSSSASFPCTSPSESESTRPRRPAPKARQRKFMCDGHDSSIPPSPGDPELVCSPGVAREEREERVQGVLAVSPSGPPSESTRPRRPAPTARQRNFTCDVHGSSVPPSVGDPELACFHAVAPDEREERVQGTSSSGRAVSPSGPP
eukprot:TRINITY_DN6238_c0_g1_i1.p1 TRINITY_DN6238_c0_g1~~TRINITY_DN6238_c0_g1_i1.p1  ORF type:complete len:320 (-),score=27.43 TRINITY_DN6238_c0_g1_i1:437-1396(-)